MPYHGAISNLAATRQSNSVEGGDFHNNRRSYKNEKEEAGLEATSDIL